jgi:hypothetical protein
VGLPAARTRRVSARVLSAAAAAATLVACGSAVGPDSTTGSLSAPSSPLPAAPSPPPSSSSPVFSSGPPPASISMSLAAPASSPVPASSWPNPAASNFSVPPATSVPSVSLLDVEHGVAVIAVLPGAAQSEHPSTLWLSTDLSHWRDVTPPAMRHPRGADVYASFDQASFISPTTGWVTTWNGWNLAVTIYRTADGGKSWTSAPGGAHSFHAGDAEWIQLLSPTLAFSETVTPVAPRMYLRITTDAGASWRTLYTGPSFDNGNPPPNPFLLPMVFTSRLRGFAATAIPPSDFEVAQGQGFFQTTDGGVSWTVLTPPRAPSSACPPPEDSAIECLFAVPSFSDSTHGVLASEVVDGAHATVGFDITTDGGSTWRLTTTVDVPIPLVPAGSYPKSYALVATPSSRDWWIVSPNAGGVTTRVTSDAGQHWSASASSDVLGAPGNVKALDATHALLDAEVTTSNGTTGSVYVTSDGGRSWKTLFGS